MSSLGKTLARFQSLRRKFDSMLGTANVRSTRNDPAAEPEAMQMQEVPAFGSNPGNLRMYAHRPGRLLSAAPLVVALHGCGQGAVEFDHGTGWSTLADRLGFVVVYPEQQSSNNPKSCFSWFQPGDIVRNSGEALSIHQMVEHAIETFGADRRKVFITGLSAGGAMANAMLATYPEVYAGGAIIGGLAYGCGCRQTVWKNYPGHSRPRPAPTNQAMSI